MLCHDCEFQGNEDKGDQEAGWILSVVPQPNPKSQMIELQLVQHHLYRCSSCKEVILYESVASIIRRPGRKSVERLEKLSEGTEGQKAN